MLYSRVLSLVICISMWCNVLLHRLNIFSCCRASPMSNPAQTLHQLNTHFHQAQAVLRQRVLRNLKNIWISAYLAKTSSLKVQYDCHIYRLHPAKLQYVSCRIKMDRAIDLSTILWTSQANPTGSQAWFIPPFQNWNWNFQLYQTAPDWSNCMQFSYF